MSRGRPSFRLGYSDQRCRAAFCALPQPLLGKTSASSTQVGEGGVNRIVLAHFFHFGSIYTAFNLQEVASSYFLMRGRLIGLYHNSHSALLPRLEATL